MSFMSTDARADFVPSESRAAPASVPPRKRPRKPLRLSAASSLGSSNLGSKFRSGERAFMGVPPNQPSATGAAPGGSDTVFIRLKAIMISWGRDTLIYASWRYLRQPVFDSKAKKSLDKTPPLRIFARRSISLNPLPDNPQRDRDQASHRLCRCRVFIELCQGDHFFLRRAGV